MMVAVHNGGGTMAQFNHPEFGGAGQWMMGGMTMVSDLFNHSLKNSVNHLCSDIAGSLSEHQLLMPIGSGQSQSQSGQFDSQSQHSGSFAAAAGGNTLFADDPSTRWWPRSLGHPSATGDQNQMRYAYFGDRSRLAVQTGSDVWVYDTGDHQIGGFAQQQGGNTGITLTSQFGVVPLAVLPVVWRGPSGADQTDYRESAPDPANANDQSADGTGGSSPPASGATSPAAPGATSPAAPGAMAPSAPGAMAPSAPAASAPADVMDLLERLANLKERGLVSDEEFATKKSELLARL